MRPSGTEVRRIEKAEKKQEKILLKKKAHMSKVSLKGDSESLKKANGEVDGAQQALERIREDKRLAEIQDLILTFVAHNQPVEIAEIANALNLPADNIEKHIGVLDVVKTEAGKIYSAGNNTSGIKIKEKLTSLKDKIREICYKIKSKRVDGVKTVDKRLSIGSFLATLTEDAKAEDTRWIEPAMSFLVAISSVISYIYSRSFFMEPPTPGASMDWCYGLARLDLYQGVFLWLIVLAIIGGLFLIRYRKIGVPILILGAVFQFLLSPVYLISSQPPTPSFQIVALMPLILAACLVMIGFMAWIRRPLSKERVEELKIRLKRKKEVPEKEEAVKEQREKRGVKTAISAGIRKLVPKGRVEGLKKRLERKKEVPASSDGVMEQRETFRTTEETNAQENAVSNPKNETKMKAAISEYLVDSGPDIVAYIRRICYDVLWLDSFMERSKTIVLEKYPDFISTCKLEYLEWLNELESTKEPGISDSELSIYTERIKLCDQLFESLDSEQMSGYQEVVDGLLIEEWNKVIQRIDNVLQPFFELVSAELEGDITKEDQIRVFMSAYLNILGDSESAPIWI